MTDTDQINAELFCPLCGYDLRGISSGRCPECGTEIDREKLDQPLIPWCHRATIGRYRAFVRTVAMSFRRPSMLAGDAGRPVSYSDAQRFRWIVVLLLWVPLAVAAVILRWALGKEGFLVALVRPFDVTRSQQTLLDDLRMCLGAGPVMWWVWPVSLLLFLVGLTGIGSYFSAPASLSVVRQNRAIALSLYACGPLALLLPVGALAGLAALLAHGVEAHNGAALLIYAALTITAELLILAALVGWWHSSLRILHRGTHCSLARVITAGVCVPLMWILMAVLTLGVFPAACGFVRIVVRSCLG